MKKLIILIIGLLSLQLSAQNIELTIVPNSIKVHDNHLYFRYRIQNNSGKSFVLYDAGLVDVATSEEQYDWNMYAASGAGLSCFIYDKNGNFRPRNFTGLRDYWPIAEELLCGDSIVIVIIKPVERTYQDSIIDLYFRKDIILNPGEFVEYDRKLDIGKNEIKYDRLEKGTYKFKLKYGFFSDFYRKEYISSRELNTPPSLKNTLLFEGEIWSEFYSFEYP